MPISCLRLFTVYGPYGRPDMAPYKFTKAAIENKPINVHNNGIHQRDFTYVKDVSYSIYKLIKKPPKENYFQIINICSSKTIKLLKFIKIIEKILNKKINKIFIKKQDGDVIKTYGNNKKLKKLIKIKKFVKIEEGMKKFIKWYMDYHV